MIAAVIGGWMIRYASWRWVFVFQGLMDRVAWIGVFRMRESLAQFETVSAAAAARVCLRLFENRRFTDLLAEVPSPFSPGRGQPREPASA